MEEYIPQCGFCGASVGEISEGTGITVTAIYDCPKCGGNYCDQCSYEEEINGEKVQLCLRCDSKLGASSSAASSLGAPVLMNNL